MRKRVHYTWPRQGVERPRFLATCTIVIHGGQSRIPRNDYHGYRRVVHRITLAGDKPRGVEVGEGLAWSAGQMTTRQAYTSPNVIEPRPAPAASRRCTRVKRSATDTGYAMAAVNAVIPAIVPRPKTSR